MHCDAQEYDLQAIEFLAEHNQQHLIELYKQLYWQDCEKSNKN